MDKIGLFEFTTNFCGDKTDLRSHPLFKESYDRFMVNRVLSMSPKTCGLAMFMSRYDDIPKELHFAFLNAEVDREFIFFNYAKETHEIPKKHRLYLQEYFQCSRDRAIEYIRMMSEKQIDTIIKLYKTRDKYAKKKIKMKKGK